MTAGVALSKSTTYHGYSRYQFPQWLTKMSRTKGLRNVQKSVNEKLSSYCHTSRYVSQVEIFPYYRYLFKKDEGFVISQIKDLEYDAEELGFILGEKTDSALIRHLIEKSKVKTPEKKEEESVEIKEDEKGENESKKMAHYEIIDKDKGPELRQKNLTDF
jgi:replication factor C large subunit